jgi:ABC-type Zn uptake system ZnuABC Zn-binding protein ZnuA
MKKVLAIALIAGTMVACGNKSDKKEGENKDTTKVETPVTPTQDTTKPAVDTTKHVADTTKPGK